MPRRNPVDLSKADIKVMVMQLTNSARRLKKHDDMVGAADAAETASLYAADAGMDVRFHRSLRVFLDSLKKQSTNPKSKNLVSMQQIMRNAMK